MNINREKEFHEGTHENAPEGTQHENFHNENYEKQLKQVLKSVTSYLNLVCTEEAFKNQK